MMPFVTSPPPANDNAARPEAPPEVPIVRTPRGRARATYASADGVILPLAFARRMEGWQALSVRRISRNASPRA